MLVPNVYTRFSPSRGFAPGASYNLGFPPPTAPNAATRASFQAGANSVRYGGYAAGLSHISNMMGIDSMGQGLANRFRSRATQYRLTPKYGSMGYKFAKATGYGASAQSLADRRRIDRYRTIPVSHRAISRRARQNPRGKHFLKWSANAKAQNANWKEVGTYAHGEGADDGIGGRKRNKPGSFGTPTKGRPPTQSPLAWRKRSSAEQAHWKKLMNAVRFGRANKYLNVYRRKKKHYRKRK